MLVVSLGQVIVFKIGRQISSARACADEEYAMRIDWGGVPAECFSTKLQNSHTTLSRSIPLGNQARAESNPSNASHSLKRICLRFAAVLGGIALVMLMFETVLAQHASLHAEFCHEIQVRYGLAYIASAAWDFVYVGADAAHIVPLQPDWSH